jgi:hypothetical protein
MKTTLTRRVTPADWQREKKNERKDSGGQQRRRDEE